MFFPQGPQQPYTGGPADRQGMWEQMPPAASTFAADVDPLFYAIHWVSAFFFLLLTFILLYSVVKWRRKTEDQPAVSNVTHNSALEVTWTVIPLIIVMVIFVWGWQSARDMTLAPKDALTYKVVAKKWDWTITQPGDADSDALINEIWVPKGKACVLVMSSKDVLHSFFIPAFRVKRDVIPGRYQTMWFRPTMLGDFDLFCAEYCGDGHSKMIGWGTVHVVDPERFATKPWQTESDIPWERGKKWYERQCATCHTLDGTILVGPSWKGIWGREVELTDGAKVKVDEAYVKESIRNPNAKKQKAFATQQMTPFDEVALKDSRVQDIIEYMKHITEGK